MQALVVVDHPAWAALQAHLTKNVEAYLGIFSAVCIASVCTMPEKCVFIVGEPDTWWKKLIQQLWTWVRNTLQTAVPAARASNNYAPPPPLIPSPEPKQEKKP